MLDREVLRTDGDQGIWFCRFDGWGRRWCELEPSGAVVRRTSDPAGNLTMGDPTAGGATLLVRQAEVTSSAAAARTAAHQRSGAGGPEVLLVERQFARSWRVIATKSGPAGVGGHSALAHCRARA